MTRAIARKPRAVLQGWAVLPEMSQRQHAVLSPALPTGGAAVPVAAEHPHPAVPSALPGCRLMRQQKRVWPPARRPDAGFTLIETLVALAVLALSAVALLGATEAHIARIGGLEARAAAQWVAENHLTERTLGLEPEAPAPVLGFAFSVTEDRQPTADPDLSQIDIAVADSADGTVYARLTGFLAAPTGSGG